MKTKVINLLNKETKLLKEELENLVEIPKDPQLGDFAFPCFKLSKDMKKSPLEISKELASTIKSPDFEKIISAGPYLNFFINRKKLAENILRKILKEKENFGKKKKNNKKILIDCSSPNIAKPFGIGHLRSTIIGNAIAKISEFQGYSSIKINYLGDWGTQFGKLITGYKKFSDEKKLKENPIAHLQEIYVKVNQDSSLDQESRDWFKKLEQGDKSALLLWKKFRELSLVEFQKIYDLLEINFEVLSGESLYNKKMNSTVSLLSEKGLLSKSDGAEIVNLEDYGLGVALIRKSDGATLYATRDLTAAIDRFRDYNFEKMIYEVGSEQTLHFKQVFKILNLLGFKWSEKCIHVAHGLYLDKDGKKFSTRRGKNVYMIDVLNETISLAEKEISKREPEINSSEVKKRAKKVALAAVFYGDLRNYRLNDSIFDIEKFLSFEGNTGPYLLYTYARAKSILKKSQGKKLKNSNEKITNSEKNLIFQLSQFPEIVEKAYNDLAPNILANYSYSISKSFNEYYHSTQVIDSEQESFRLNLVESFSIILKSALNLLGISVLERM